MEQQRDLLINFCKEKGWRYRSFLDEAMSGSISDRPGWQELLKEVARGGYDAIVVVKTDRITRSLKYELWFYDWLLAHATVQLVSIYDSVDPQTPDGYFTFMLNCLLSEREILINRWRPESASNARRKKASTAEVAAGHG